MDRKNPVLLVLMIMLFGIAVAGAIWIFGQRNIQVRRDHIISHIQYVAADAFQFRLRPRTLGGGGGSYDGYTIPLKLRSSNLADYALSRDSSPETLVVVATAASDLGTVTATVEPTGAVTILALTGELSY